MALTNEQKRIVLDYVQSRLNDKVPAYRAEYIYAGEAGNIVKLALPANEVVGELSLAGTQIGVRTDSNGRIVYGSRVKVRGRQRRKPLTAEQLTRFIEAFGDLLKRVE